MLRTRTLLLPIVTIALGIVPVVACRTNEAPPPPPTDQAPVDTASENASHHKEPKEPVDLKPVGLGGGPQATASESPTPATAPTSVGKPTVKPHPKTPKPKTAPSPSTWTIPFPSTWPSQWWPFPSAAPSSSGSTAPGAGTGAAKADAGKDWATGK